MPQPDASDSSNTASPKMRHDQFFKETFSDLPRAREFFQHTLPPEIAQAARWETLQLLPTSFVGADLADSEADLLYLVELGSGSNEKKSAVRSAVYLYVLFEHQSTVDWNMPFRLLKYIVNIWEAQEKGKARFFPVLPVIFHQEAGQWTAPRGVWEWLCLKNKGSDKLAFLRPWVPDFRHLVLETSAMGDLSGQVSTLLSLAVSLMKAAAEGQELAWWDAHGKELSEVVRGDERALRALRAMLTYLISTTQENEYSTIVEKMERLEDEKLKGFGMRSVADVFIEKALEEGRLKGEAIGKIEGKAKGIQIGEKRGTIRTLRMVLNLDPMPEEDLEKLSVEELERLAGELMARLHHRT